jgi:predicted CXXCH cytochrome family protein
MKRQDSKTSRRQDGRPVLAFRRRWAVAIALPAALAMSVGGSWLIWARVGSPPHETGTGIVTVSRPVPPAPRPDHVVEFSDGCVTAECHASMSGTYSVPRTRTIHEPVAQHACEECHALDAGGHTYPLLRTGEALCSHCHQTGGLGPSQHKAIADEGCTACHDPHTSSGRFLLIADTVEQTCARCHPASGGDHRHWPYAMGQCDVCHEPHGAGPPSDARALLRGWGVGTARAGGAEGGVDGHCRLCHAETVDAMAGSLYSHRDAEGSCLACHSAHAASWKGLQRSEPRLGCIGCHDDIALAIDGARVSHDAVLIGDQCASCHEPHASANAMMLRDDHAPVCMNCHSEQVATLDGRHIAAMAATLAASPLVHGPVAAGNCAACHSVHGGQHARLLKEIYPTVLVGGFDTRNYALCFSCHDQNLALVDTAEATRFRDGDVNLHRVHLQAGDRSRSCAACHAVHSSNRPRLIADTVAYDGSPWMMPMGFVLTPDGGGCSPGCHEPLDYSRSARKRASEANEAIAP